MFHVFHTEKISIPSKNQKEIEYPWLEKYDNEMLRNII